MNERMNMHVTPGSIEGAGEASYLGQKQSPAVLEFRAVKELADLPSTEVPYSEMLVSYSETYVMG